ncbi:MAG: hypothetical protein P1U53_04665, partial [Sulfitobacter sp.]|nr:hypothetical protein [Sulfitobacter sp.]
GRGLRDGSADAGSFRDERATIGATTRFDPELFEGTYHLAAAMTETGEAPQPRRNSYYWTAEENQIGLRSVIGSDGASEVLELYEVAGPGRLAKPYAETEQDREVWVLWTDADYRTVVLADPGGSFAEIWDRSTEPSPDRLAAAREILDFNGFDLNQLQSVRT